MIHVRSWNDLRAYGFDALTGEACGLMYRVLFDVTERGESILAKCLGLPQIKLAEPWNRGSPDDPHVGSVLLAPEMLNPLAIFALLETGCVEAWLNPEGVVGVESTDSAKTLELLRSSSTTWRRFRYAGTAGDRNRHVMSGRIY